MLHLSTALESILVSTQSHQFWHLKHEMAGYVAEVKSQGQIFAEKQVSFSSLYGSLTSAEQISSGFKGSC